MNRTIRIIKNKKGASLLIVLACMMFLITLATITLTSSLGVASTSNYNKSKAQIDLLAQSVQISIQDMLNVDTLPVGSGTNLQTAIVSSAYNYANSTDVIVPPLFDKMTISVDENVTAPDGGVTTVTHDIECELDISELKVIGGDVSGVIWVNASFLLDLDTDKLGEQAVYRMGFNLDNAIFDETTSSITSYGKWTLVKYEKVEQ